MRAVLVHGLPDALAALDAAEGRPVLLASAPGAAGYAGAAWWAKLAAQVRAARPGVPFTALLDCADDAGRVLEALRLGVTDIAFDGTPEAATRLADIAGQLGAVLHPPPPHALDLRGARDPVATCRQWLEELEG